MLASAIAAAPSLPEGGLGSWREPRARLHNVVPRSRDARRGPVDREHLEKQRLSQRREVFAAFADPGALIAPEDTAAAAHLSGEGRFGVDFATEDRFARAAAVQRRAAVLAKRRDDEAVREARRWEAMEAARVAEEERLTRLRTDGGKARRNASGMPFDPITLAYAANGAGESLRAADDGLKQRAASRADMLSSKSRGADYHIISGEGGPVVGPAAPSPMAAMRADSSHVASLLHADAGVASTTSSSSYAALPSSSFAAIGGPTSYGGSRGVGSVLAASARRALGGGGAAGSSGGVGGGSAPAAPPSLSLSSLDAWALDQLEGFGRGRSGPPRREDGVKSAGHAARHHDPLVLG